MQKAKAAPYLLVVDDLMTNRLMLVRYLTNLGYHTSEAENGRQALERLHTQRFDLVLLDVDMPELDGYQVLEQLKADPQLRDLPVIMISVIDQFDSIVRCIELGAEDYLPKPFNPVLLKARVNACLARKHWRDLELEYLEQVNRLAKAAAEIENDTFRAESLEEVAARPDELGRLVRVFLQMAGYFYRREARLQEQLQEMRFEIIQNSVTKKVEELAKSSTFLELEHKIFQIIENLEGPDELQA